MSSYLIVFLGAGIGGALRHGVNLGSARLFGTGFPVATLIVNVTGSLLMGVIVVLLALRSGEGWPQPARLFLTTGILGGFTTFSAFSLDAVLLYERGEVAQAILYAAASTILSIAALAAGMAIARSLP